MGSFPRKDEVNHMQIQRHNYNKEQTAITLESKYSDIEIESSPGVDETWGNIFRFLIIVKSNKTVAPVHCLNFIICKCL